MPGVRRKARILALQVLFEVDCASHDLEATLQRALEESDLPEDGKAFTRELVTGVARNRALLDEAISKHAPAWPVEQLSLVDRNTLRIAIFEILLNNKTPAKAAINEAVELSKLFGSQNIHRFINGVLGSIVGEMALGNKEQS